MSIRAIVFDIGGVLEITPDLGVAARWEQRLQLQPGELNRRLREVWRGGSLGTISQHDVQRKIGEIMGLSDDQVHALMDDVWQEYLGTLNTELVAYIRGLRPTYQTALLSNSFVGAREREQARYHFDQLCDCIVYSHEVGLEKPDPRIYLLTCQQLGRQPAEVIFVDDRPPAVEGARHIGMHGILFTNNAQTIAAIQACIRANQQ